MEAELSQQTSLLRAVLDATGDAVVQLDSTGVITGWNRAAARLLGAGERAALGRAFPDFLHETHHAEWASVLERVRTGEQVRIAPLLVRRADGPMLPAAATFTAIDGGCCLVLRDESEQLFAQETLAASERRVRRSEALAGVGTFVVDVGGAEQWSEGMFRLLRLDPADFDGTVEGHLALVHPLDRAAVAAAFETARTGRPAELDHRAVVGTDVLWVFLAVEPLLDDGGLVGVSGVCQDITARKASETAARSALVLEQRANEELRRLDALKDEFLATVSHELRTPLTSIIGFARLLSTAPSEVMSAVEPILRNGLAMAQMIEKLLDYSRLQAGHVALNPEPIDLSAEVDQLMGQQVSPAGDQVLLNEVPGDFRLVTDRDALHRIMGNLIGNARHHAGAGTTVRVQAARESDGSALLSVADDGAGIAPHLQAQLFDRFYQVPGTGGRGTGIGLAIVREYVRQQGGTVWCESDAGQGTTFHVRLPQPREPTA